jgi:hypothetical protein
MSTIGWSILGPDNDTEMYSRDDHFLARCPTCRYRLDFQATNPDYVPRKRKSILRCAVTCTYDGQYIVTAALKAFCEAQAYEHVVFVGFPKHPEAFQLIATKQVEVEPYISGVRWQGRCPECRNHESVVLGGSRNPLTVKTMSPLVNGIYRTDLAFGNCDGKSPIVIVGLDTKANMVDAGLKGIIFAPVHGVS